jgi:hypothetical protein
MAAAASQHDDEPIDLAAAEMSAADFQVIEHVHAICNHAPARELPAEPDLIAHAAKILGAQIRAAELLREMKQRGDSDLNVSDLVETDSEDEAVTESQRDESHQCDSSVSWAQIAADAWAGASWKVAAMDYHRAERGKRGVRQ